MDCQEIKEILDAYALGALEGEETRGLEKHVAECLRCWGELTEAQRAATALALGVPLHTAGPDLRRRVLAAAQRRRAPGALFGTAASRLRPLRLPAVGAVAAAVAVVAVALSALLFVQVRDLHDDRDRLEREIASARQITNQMRQMEAVRSAPDVQSVLLSGTLASPEALGTYYWSRAMGTGVLVCNNLEALGAGQTYQVWLFVDNRPVTAGTFASWQGLGQWVVDLRSLELAEVDAVGVSIEPEGGSAAPTGEMILWGVMPEEY